MDIEVLNEKVAVVSLALFSLAWFVVGVLAGRQTREGGTQQQKQQKKKKKAAPASSAEERVELYVGNLPYSVRSRELKQAFAEHGNVLSARVIHNKMSGKSKGFGFVEMEASAAHAASKAMSGKEFQGRKLVVNEAKSRSRD